MSASVAVAVVSWNTRDLLRRCLESLRPEADEGRAEVWVVDNGSTDGSCELVEAEFEWVRLLRPNENLGFGRAVNLVAERTDSPWLVAANADTAVEPGALAALIAAAEANPGAGAVAPRLVLPNGAAQHSVHPFPTLPTLAFFNFGLHHLRRRRGNQLALAPHWDPSEPRQVDWALGAFLLLRRDAFDAVGRFDASQWMYTEDLDLGWRLVRGGWHTRFEPRAVVLHESEASARQAFGDDPAERWMDATYAWIERRRGRPRAVAAALLYLLGAAGRLDRRWARIHARGLRRLLLGSRR